MIFLKWFRCWQFSCSFPWYIDIKFIHTHAHTHGPIIFINFIVLFAVSACESSNLCCLLNWYICVIDCCHAVSNSICVLKGLKNYDGLIEPHWNIIHFFFENSLNLKLVAKIMMESYLSMQNSLQLSLTNVHISNIFLFFSRFCSVYHEHYPT